ncbi:MAG: DNA repair protein RecO [Anaerovoracaceae bacterium]
MITDTEGIILRQTKIIGGRRMVLLFSQKFGKISASTGINERGKGKSALAMRPFTYGRYELFKNRDMYNINGSEVKKSYYKIGEDIDKYMSSAYVLELTEKVLVEEHPSPAIFRLILDFFAAMETRKRKHMTLVLAYEVKLLKILGVMPQLDLCIKCGENKKPALFSVKDGGIICEKCGRNIQINGNDTLIYPAKFDIVDILNYFSSNSLSSLENLALEEAIQNQLQIILKQYVAYYLDIGELKSESFLIKE